MALRLAIVVMSMSNNTYCEHLKLARGQLRRLATAERHFLEMAEAWEDVDNALVGDFSRMADQLGSLVQLLHELMADGKNGSEWDGE